MLTVQRRNTSKSRTNCVREKIQTADFPFTKDCFDLGPHFLDGIQIRAIGRKVQQSYTFRFQNLPDGFYMVRVPVVFTSPQRMQISSSLPSVSQVASRTRTL